MSQESGKPEPRVKSQLLRIEIRRCLRMKLRYDEIMDQLRLPRSTFFRHLASIRAEDREWLLEQAKNHFVSSYRMSLDFLESQERELMAIREQATKPTDKIKATEAICEIEWGLIGILAYGPLVLGIEKRMRESNLTLPTGSKPWDHPS